MKPSLIISMSHTSHKIKLTLIISMVRTWLTMKPSLVISTSHTWHTMKPPLVISMSQTWHTMKPTLSICMSHTWHKIKVKLIISMSNTWHDETTFNHQYGTNMTRDETNNNQQYVPYIIQKWVRMIESLLIINTSVLSHTRHKMKPKLIISIPHTWHIIEPLLVTNVPYSWHKFESPPIVSVSHTRQDRTIVDYPAVCSTNDTRCNHCWLSMHQCIPHMKQDEITVGYQFVHTFHGMDPPLIISTSVCSHMTHDRTAANYQCIMYSHMKHNRTADHTSVCSHRTRTKTACNSRQIHSWLSTHRVNLPLNHIRLLAQRSQLWSNLKVSWCFEPSQPQGIVSGWKRTSIHQSLILGTSHLTFFKQLKYFHCASLQHRLQFSFKRITTSCQNSSHK